MSETVTPEQRAALEALGYSDTWLTTGILDPALLAEQHQRLQAGGTRKLTKYRAQALAAWCGREGAIDEGQIEAYLALAAADPDAKLAQVAITALIQSPRLALEQLSGLASSDPKLLRRHEPLIRRVYLTRRLEEGVTDELVQQVIELKDASVQTALIRDARLARKHAELLAKQGANLTIREMAQAWFQDKKAWK
jgi:hypothetical protein